MPLALQVKLLRVLQERARRAARRQRVDRRFDCRVVAATKVDLQQLAARGSVPRRPVLPPQRRVASSCRRCASGATTSRCCSRTSRGSPRCAYGAPAPAWTAAADGRLAVATPGPATCASCATVADRFVLGVEAAAPAGEAASASLDAQVDAFERSLIETELRRTQGHVLRSAEALGLPRKTLYDRLKRHGLDPTRFACRRRRELSVTAGRRRAPRSRGPRRPAPSSRPSWPSR